MLLSKLLPVLTFPSMETFCPLKEVGHCLLGIIGPLVGSDIIPDCNDVIDGTSEYQTVGWVLEFIVGDGSLPYFLVPISIISEEGGVEFPIVRSSLPVFGHPSVVLQVGLDTDSFPLWRVAADDFSDPSAAEDSHRVSIVSSLDDESIVPIDVSVELWWIVSWDIFHDLMAAVEVVVKLVDFIGTVWDRVGFNEHVGAKEVSPTSIGGGGEGFGIFVMECVHC